MFRIAQPIIAALSIGVALVIVSCSSFRGPKSDAAIEQVRALEEQVKEAQRSAAEIEAALARGEITQAERDAEIARLSALVLDGFAAIEKAMKEIDMEDIAKGVADGVRDTAPLLPSPWKEVAMFLGLVATGAYAKAQVKANDKERDMRRQLRGEPINATPARVARPPARVDIDV